MTVIRFPRELWPKFEEYATGAGLRMPDTVEGDDATGESVNTWNIDLTPEEIQTVYDCIAAIKYGMSLATYRSIAQNIADVKAFRQKANADITNNDQSKAIKDLAKIVFAHLKDD